MKFRMFLSHAARRAVPMLLLAAVLGGVLVAASGKYTFSFLLDKENTGGIAAIFTPLGESVGTPSAPTADSAALPDRPTPTPEPVSSLSLAATEEDVLRLGGAGGDSALYADTIPTVPMLLSAGFSRSTLPYTKTTALLAYAGGFDFTPAARSVSDGDVTTLTYVRPDILSAPEPVYSTIYTELPAVELYMGYILVDQGDGTIRLYTSDGGYLLTYIRAAVRPACTRDRNGTPLFLGWIEEENEDGGTVLAERYLTAGPGGFTVSDYDDAVEGRGLYFDYAPGYGLTDTNLIRLANRVTTVTPREGGEKETSVSYLFAYGITPQWRRTNFRFATARDFSEGLACVTDPDTGHLYFIGENGYQAFVTESNYYYYERFVTEYLLPPLTAGEESIGFYYYDHGLVRARRQVVDWYGVTYIDTLRVSVDEDVLLDKEGNIFPLPEGYDIISYSDGVILLEKDGKYGYMDYTGAWIAQPIYDYARPFSEGLAVVGMASGLRMMIDTNGDAVIPAGQYEIITDASSGVIAAWSRATGWQFFHKMAKFE